MTGFDELNALSTAELHERAVKRAEHHLDVRFFWRLLEAIPAAEAAAGDPVEGELDAASAARQLRDYVHRGGELDDALRPLYIDYLERHAED